MLCGVVLVALAPVVTDSIGKDTAGLVECGRSDATTDVGVTFEAVLGVLVPEVERAVGARGAERSVLGMEGDIVDGVAVDDIAGRGVAVALEREV